MLEKYYVWEYFDSMANVRLDLDNTKLCSTFKFINFQYKKYVSTSDWG